jgi:hypothetical protein
LVKDRKVQSLRQRGQSGLPRPEPCGAKIEPCPGNLGRKDTPAQPGLCLDQKPISALRLKPVSKGEARKTAADDENFGVHWNAPQGCLHGKAADAAQGAMRRGLS